VAHSYGTGRRWTCGSSASPWASWTGPGCPPSAHPATSRNADPGTSGSCDGRQPPRHGQV